MSGQEIYEELMRTLQALARSNGVGVDFMEPLVFMGKLRIVRTPEKDELYYWQQTPLLRVRREKQAQGIVWSFISPDNIMLRNFLQTIQI